MAINIRKQQLVMITATTSIAFAMDVIIYNSASKEKGFKLPSAKESLQILVVGIVMGLAIDYSLNKIKRSIQTKVENEIDDLADKEVKNIQTNPIEYKDKNPVKIQYEKLA